MIKKKIIAIIPARGGSTRIPKKNIINFCGKPLIAWTIEAAKKSKLFDRIIVGTDSAEIANVAKSFGAEVPFLRTQHIDNHAPVSLAIISILNKVKEILNEEYQTVFSLMANCPLRNHEDIKSACKNFQREKTNFQLSCFKFGWMNPWWAFKMNKNSKPKFIFKDKLTERSQDLPNLYCPTGAIWIANIAKLLKAKTFYGPNHIFWKMKRQHAVDIDNYQDLEFAKIVFKQKNIL